MVRGGRSQGQQSRVDASGTPPWSSSGGLPATVVRSHRLACPRGGNARPVDDHRRSRLDGRFGCEGSYRPSAGRPRGNFRAASAASSSRSSPQKTASATTTAGRARLERRRLPQHPHSCAANHAVGVEGRRDRSAPGCRPTQPGDLDGRPAHAVRMRRRTRALAARGRGLMRDSGLEAGRVRHSGVQMLVEGVAR